MIPRCVTFAGQEIIPGLQAVPTDEPAILVLEGSFPIIISASHAGTPGTTPAEAKAFGERADDPNVGGTFRTDDDTNTLPIAFAVVRTLSSLGVVPYAVINLVSRRYMDLNRTWQGQQMWQAPGASAVRPGDETKTVAEFPRVVEFDAFRQSYYQNFHDTLRRFTESQHPDGWLFDVHGNSQSATGRTLQIITTLGFTARRDFVYDNPANLHRFLVDGGFAVDPTAADPGQEPVKFAPNGDAEMNLISGGRYGARPPPANRANLPTPGPVVPGPQPRRVHGVQFEIDGSLRHGQSPEQLESVGINLAFAIYRCLLGNGLIQRTPSPRAGEHALVGYAFL